MAGHAPDMCYQRDVLQLAFRHQSIFIINKLQEKCVSQIRNSGFQAGLYSKFGR